MASVDDVIGEVQREIAVELRGRLRERLLRQPREWLVDELMARLDGCAAPALALPDIGPALESDDARRRREADRLARASRIKALCVDESCLHAFMTRCQGLTREHLEHERYLLDPPDKGSALIGPACRTPKGDALLRDAKDVLVALLFGDAASGVPLARVQRELLTITVARGKAEAIACLLRAATEIEAEGTWRDPERVADDDRAPNTQLEVEYGEVATEVVGHGIAVALRLINDLEINEQVLYARMENVEESTLQEVS